MRLPKIPYWPLLIGPWLTLGLGYVLNFIVMGANHGQMPVLVPGNVADFIPPNDFIHSIMTSATHLKFLADWLVIRDLGIASPGDFFEWAGDFAIVPAFTAWMALVIKKHHDLEVAKEHQLSPS